MFSKFVLGKGLAKGLLGEGLGQGLLGEVLGEGLLGKGLGEACRAAPAGTNSRFEDLSINGINGSGATRPATARRDRRTKNCQLTVRLRHGLRRRRATGFAEPFAEEPFAEETPFMV